MALAASRIVAERVRLERLGIIDASGNLVSTALPADMLPLERAPKDEDEPRARANGSRQP